MRIRILDFTLRHCTYKKSPSGFAGAAFAGATMAAAFLSLPCFFPSSLASLFLGSGLAGYTAPLFFAFSLQSFEVYFFRVGVSTILPFRIPNLTRCWSKISSNRPEVDFLRFHSSESFANFLRTPSVYCIAPTLVSSESMKLSRPMIIDSTFQTGFHDSGCQSLIVKQMKKLS